MKVSSLLKGGIYKISFGYKPEMEGYATLMLDILELYAIVSKRLMKEVNVIEMKCN